MELGGLKMDKFRLDEFYKELEQLEELDISPEPADGVGEILVDADAEMMANFKKVAFDLFEDQDGAIWRLHEEDGEEWLVRFEDPITEESDWAVVQDSEGDVTIAYQRVPVQRIAKASLQGIDIEDFRFWLDKQLKTEEYQRRVVAQLDQTKKEKLFAKFASLRELV